MTPDNAASMAAVMALFSPWGEVGGLDDRSEQMPSRIWFSRSAQLEVMDHHRHRNVRLAIRGIEGFGPVLITADGPHGVSIGEPAFDGLTLGGETDYVAGHQDFNWSARRDRPWSGRLPKYQPWAFQQTHVCRRREHKASAPDAPTRA